MTNTMTDENTGTSYDLTGDTNFDFGDGNGSVPAHKHMNGGGWVAETASVDASAFVGPEARVYGEARVCTTPILLTGYEFAITICDNQMQVGCKTIMQSVELSADLFPEEQCPRLRTAATLIIHIIKAHWDYCKDRGSACA